MAVDEEAALQQRLEANAKLINALLETQESLYKSQQQYKAQVEQDTLVITSLVKTINFNVDAAGGKAKRRLSMDVGDDGAGFRSAGTTAPEGGMLKPLSLAEKVALLDQLVESLQALQGEVDVDQHRQVAELNTLRDLSFKLLA
mmetsp:Transcript_1813/g.5088  ORF Transcript_1813/g.5088 Transcript_1813/m.5088 type:complete len:144 (-) Transcript_1813:835-1266(-)